MVVHSLGKAHHHNTCWDFHAYQDPGPWTLVHLISLIFSITLEGIDEEAQALRGVIWPKAIQGIMIQTQAV